MYLLFKLTFILLILYLKLNCFKAIPLIDPHKSSSHSAPTEQFVSVAAANENGEGQNDKDNNASIDIVVAQNRNKSQNNNNNKSIRSHKTTRATTTTTRIKTKAILNATISQNINPILATANKKGESLSSSPPLIDNQHLSFTPIAIDENAPNNTNTNNKNNYYFYYNATEEELKDQQPSVNIIYVPSPLPSPSPLPPAVNDLLTFRPETISTVGIPNQKNDVLQNFSTETNQDKEDEENAGVMARARKILQDETISDDEISLNAADDQDNANSSSPSLGDILMNSLNPADRYFLNLNRVNDDACLLDDLKESLIWWSNRNGSLRGEAIVNMTSRNSFLDLSFRNISEDNCLYGKTRSHTFRNGRSIIAFSAAANNLTHAPYRTLSLMNSTLKYLTLKGNQFAAYTPEMQREAISRLFNESSRFNESTPPPTGATTARGNRTMTTDESDGPTTTMNPDLIESMINGTEETSQHASYKSTYKKYKNKILGTADEGIAWATFPPMPNLLELDISNCHIEYITRDAFKNLTNLRRLFIAHNKMLTVPFDTFQYVPYLQYLDLSFTNVLDSNYQIHLPTLEAIINLIYGVKIQQTTFRHLPDLVYLDLSHTKLTRNSAVAFTHLGENLRYMSLCYTSFPMIGNALFKNTKLVALDLSGNPYAAYNIIEDAFEGVADTLKYLYFEKSNIKDLVWLKYLSNLRVLGLSGNNINSISQDIFSPLTSLQILDLSANHIGNWYNRAFTNNEQLRVLNLRDNNINIITSEMLRDFQLLDYLGLGDNNFVCDCLLRDLMDIASANNKEAECSKNVLQSAQEILTENSNFLLNSFTPNATLLSKRGDFFYLQPSSKLGTYLESVDMTRLLMNRYLPDLQHSYENLKRVDRRLKMRFISRLYKALKYDSSSSSQCYNREPTLMHEKLNSSTLKFQLLDYEDEHYWCFNETERLNFMQLNCQSRSYVDDITEQLHTLTKYVVGSVCTVLALSLIGVVIYVKRWHIHYYFSYLKSAALVSVAAKEAADQLNTLSESDPNLVYDIFISYCQNDRQWVLEELLPNVEESGDISICMHERDFQIGVTILDNIVSCMDRSRALMLIISSNFLLSHWCQFEMQLAQHRIFEVSKEHLIVVFLEDIPRNKRPKTLQYLMEVKTYIKWPSAGKNGENPPTTDERKFFWKRLKRSLENIGLNPYPRTSESQA